MRTFYFALLILSALSGCAKKAPVQPIGDISTGTTSTNPGTNTGTVTNTGSNTNTGTTRGATTGTGTSTGTTTGTGTAVPPDSLQYLALGDSYTIGQSVPLNQSFPYQLTAKLNPTLKVGVPTIIATTGWTTYNLINGINNSGLTTKTYDFVTLLIGVNDQFQGVSQDTYRAQFAVMLNVVIRFAKGDKSKVFVLSIPDYSVTPFASYENTEQLAQTVKEIDEFNAINKSESAAAGVNYLDITDISRQAASDNSLLAPDGLHPSAKMYGLWVEKLYPLVKAKL